MSAPQPANTSEERQRIHKLTDEWIIANVDSHLGFVNWTNGHNRLTDFVMQQLADHDAKLITAYIDKFSTNGRPLSAPPLIKKMPVPCSDCGAEEYADWFIYPHQVYNAVFPGGVGHTCLPCFSKRVIALREVFNMKEEADGDSN